MWVVSVSGMPASMEVHAFELQVIYCYPNMHSLQIT